MKKTSILVYSLMSIVILTSCTLKKCNLENAQVHFTTIKTDSLLPGGLQIEFTYPDSADSASLELLQKMFIENVLGEMYAELTPEQALDAYVAEYMQFLKEQEQDSSNVPTSYYYNQINNTILLNESGFISSVAHSETYIGGAHGWTKNTGFVINLATNKLLTEKDFAGEKYEQNMNHLLVRKIMEKNEVATLEELENLGYDTAATCPNGNFSLDKKGLTYYFNEYEIAPHSLGIIEVSIPYNELEVYISGESSLSCLISK